ncbi:MAG: prefoldin subunit alpha [DPANN group archaeon]|nr:prefoldin subunit alpha [DPANN group archaeon]
MNNEIEQKYMELETLKQQVMQLNQYKMEINSRIMEVATAKQCLEGLKDTKENTKTIVPIGAGISVDATIPETKQVITSIGAGILIKKDLKDAIKTTEQLELNLNKQLKDIDNNIAIIEQESISIISEFEQLQNKNMNKDLKKNN